MMFEKLFERPHALKRQLAGPLVEERQRYLIRCADQGMKIGMLKTTAHYLLIVTKSLSLGSSSDRPISLDEIKERANLWANREPKPPMMRYDRYARLRFTCFATRFCEFINRLERGAIVRTPFDDVLDQFTNYMRNEQALSEATIELRCHTVRDLLSRLCVGGRSLNTINAAEVDAVLAEKVNAQHYVRKTVQTCASSLRGFFRYAEAQKWCKPRLAVSIMAPRVFQQESLPYGPSWDAVKTILAKTATDLPANIRDHAILIVLAMYGVRAGEVARLKLEDIDWEKELITFRRSKQLTSQPFPLAHSAAEAILRYLKEARPLSTHREVFLTTRAPFRPITSGTLWPVVARRLRPLGLPIKHHGPHALRHACATYLINEGLSLKEISDHLGHRSAETTRIYAKVDLKGLRQVAEFDLGGVI
jgi:site-specific recombinase XerD